MEKFLISKTKNKTTHLYFKSKENDELTQNLENGLLFSLLESMQIAHAEDLEQVTILVNTNTSNEALDKLFGQEVREALLKGESELFEDVDINCLTEKNIKKNNHKISNIVLAVYPEPKMVTYVQNMRNIKHEIIVPLTEDDLESYKK